MTLEAITEIMGKYSDSVNIILITGVGGIVRYLYESKEGNVKLSFGGGFMALILAASIGYISVGFISGVMGITDVNVSGSIGMILGFLYTEILKMLIVRGPKFLTNFLPGLFKLVLSNKGIDLDTEKVEEKITQVKTVDSNLPNNNNLPDA